MKESNNEMNEIVSTKNKNNLDGYKLVYPNDKNLIVKLYKENQRLLTRCDESFQWPEEKEEQLEEKTKKENSERLENKINSLLK